MAYETALYGTMLDRTKVEQMKQNLSRKYISAIEGRVIAMEQPQCKIEVNGEYITVRVKGTMKTVSAGFLPGYNGVVIQAKKESKLLNPIRRMRVNKLLKKIT